MIDKLNQLLTMYDEGSVVRIHMYNDEKKMDVAAISQNGKVDYIYYIDGEWQDVSK